jgi:cell wall-associated NlpC family hydrolase
MRRRLLLVALLSALLPAAASAGTDQPGRSWAAPEIKLVTSRGLMGATDPAAFRPDDPLTRGALAGLVSALTSAAQPPVRVSGPVEGVWGNREVPPARAAAPVTMAGLDAGLVRGLGLGDSAAAFAAGARSAGLAPPARFGTEVVARLLGLRTNHPAGRDELELLPSDTATRAEAAYSAARILRFSGWETEAVRAAAAAFALPALTPWQKRVLAVGVSLIGYPYVWGGESEHAESPFGVQARGGFDCSGFVWRVYKLQSYAGATALAGTLRGRTTFQMSGEVPKAQRIAFDALQPADVVFFGAKGPRSKPAQVDHMGIYLGNGWMIHSSGYGVALAPLDGWYRARFAWGRRPLAEAGLSPPFKG